MKELINISDSRLWVLHLASTPVAIMARYGLTTYVGVSSDDPTNIRNKGEKLTVILSAYAQSKLIGRVKIFELNVNEHRFVCLDDELRKLDWDSDTTLCVIHRVPTVLLETTAINQNEANTNFDYSMYRTVVQYTYKEKGKAGVIYETPPNFNMVGRKPHFLAFSNMLYLHHQVENYLVFINYSVSQEYSQVANVKIKFNNIKGEKIVNKEIAVNPFDCSCLNINQISELSNESLFASYTAATTSSALIPLSILVNANNGGISVEHSHPPQEYLMADWASISKIKLAAAKYLFNE